MFVFKILHGEQYLELYKPLATSGTVHSRGYVADVLDKGKGALILINGRNYTAIKSLLYLVFTLSKYSISYIPPYCPSKLQFPTVLHKITLVIKVMLLEKYAHKMEGVNVYIKAVRSTPQKKQF